MKLALVLVLLAGCQPVLRAGRDRVDGGLQADSADEADGDIGGTHDAARDAPAVTASQVVVKYDITYCDGAFACKSSYPGTSSDFTTYFGATATACDTSASQIDVPSVIDADAASGEIHFDPAMGAACITGLGYSAADCTGFWQNGPNGQLACQAALIGTVANGGTCHVDWDCASWSAYCDPSNHQCTAQQ